MLWSPSTHHTGWLHRPFNARWSSFMDSNHPPFGQSITSRLWHRFRRLVIWCDNVRFLLSFRRKYNKHHAIFSCFFSCVPFIHFRRSHDNKQSCSPFTLFCKFYSFIILCESWIYHNESRNLQATFCSFLFCEIFVLILVLMTEWWTKILS